MFAEFKFIPFCGFLSLLALGSCSKQDPDGVYKGSISDWVEEVFEGTLTETGEESRLQVILKQTPDGLLAEMKFSQPDKKEVLRTGVWEMGDGRRILRFPDGKDTSEYYLVAHGARFSFQTEQGLTNDDGSLILLMRNEGRSRKGEYPIRISFEEDGKATFDGGGIANDLPGEWRWSAGEIVVAVKLPPEKGVEGSEQSETYKYFLHWAEDASNELELEKMVIFKPFLNKDGSKRRHWMNSIKFLERPRLKQN